MGRKKKKVIKKETTSFEISLVGFLLILLSLIGFMSDTGIAGEFIAEFFGFLFGIWYKVGLVGLLIIGIYMMLKRKKPDFLTFRLTGIYIFSLGILVLSHVSYIETTTLVNTEIIKETFNNFLTMDAVKINVGGGIIGSLFTTLFISLFSIKGTNIIVLALIICGIIMFTGISVVDIIKYILSKMKIKKMIKVNKSDKEFIKKAEDKYEVDNKKVVSSVEELIHKTEDIKPSLEIKEVENNISDSKGYVFPSIDLLDKPSKNKGTESKESINHNVDVLHQVFKDFGLEGKVVAINPGPAVTQYEMELKSGTRLSKVSSLHSELSLALAAKDVRILTPIPGKSTIGVEIPNKVTSMVSIREILELIPKNLHDNKLLVTLGRDIMGVPQYCEINKTPHLLVAGTTGSGKSVCINSMIISLIMRAKPDEVKLVLVDPKKVELSMYNGIPHLITPVITDPKKANLALKKIVSEMENRYEIFENSGTKNIAGYNAYIDKKNEKLPVNERIKHLPFIVVIIDELADLMLVAAKEVEDSIMRITQMARAAGIHLIVATQRPSTDVITGVVKANIPSRISFAVSSSIDSRTILNMMGAEKLLGKGDMLFLPQGENTPVRIQGNFINDEEIKRVVDYAVKQQLAHYDSTFTLEEEEMHATTMLNDSDAMEEPLYNEIVDFVINTGKASASLLQRKFRLGYNRAARAIDLLEERGIIGPNNGSKPREVLYKLPSEEE